MESTMVTEMLTLCPEDGNKKESVRGLPGSVTIVYKL